MSETTFSLEARHIVEGEISRKATELAEAIQTLQTELTDLRKVLRAAMPPGNSQ